MNDKAGRGYWDNAWKDGVLPEANDPKIRGFRNFVMRRFHDLFSRWFSEVDTKGQQLLEIGCARSAWLPYFSREFGFRVSGIDYSPGGCEQAKAILKREGIAGDIYCEDFFSPPSVLKNRFDVVVSFGVLEHFENTANCLVAFGEFLKPGGLIVTIIPNVAGRLGNLQKILDKSIYDVHVPLDKNAVLHAHEEAGLRVISCEYFLVSNFGVCNVGGHGQSSLQWWMKKAFLALLRRISLVIWACEECGFAGTPGPNFSPYIVAIARKAG